MRRGLTPEEACIEGLQRIVRWTQSQPPFNVKYVALRRDGMAGCAALWGTAAEPPEAALQTTAGFRVIKGKWLFAGAPR